MPNSVWVGRRSFAASSERCAQRSVRSSAARALSAAVGQDRALPAHELVQAVVAAQHRAAGLARQMERVAHNDLGANLLELRRHHGVDGAVGADRHEGRRMDVAAAGAQHAGPRHAARRRARLDLDRKSFGHR
jgi:hypothetical protein